MKNLLSACTLLLAFLGAGCAATTAAVGQPGPSADDRFGVLVMAHGGSPEWNRGVLESLAPLRNRYDIEVAFGMADAASIQAAVEKLEARGARRIGVVRLFVSGESWFDRTAQILGIQSGAPPRPHHAHDAAGHEGHGMEFWRVDSDATFAMTTEGLADAAVMGPVLADRARALSRDPAHEDVLILAHGPGDDAENARWLAAIDARADYVRAALPFRRVEVATLREDWPEKRKAAEDRIRAYVARAAQEGGRAIVIPYRVHGFGPYAKVLEGLDYASDGKGLLPHPNVTAWIEDQIRLLEATPPAARRYPAGEAQAVARAEAQR